MCREIVYSGVGRVFTTTVSKLCGSSSIGKGMGGAISGGRLIPLDGPFRKTFPKVKCMNN